jgi:hypothetical protein
MDRDAKIMAACVGALLLIPIGMITVNELDQPASSSNDTSSPTSSASAQADKTTATETPTRVSSIHEWYIADSDFTSCIKTAGPASQIETLRQGGGDASTSENRSKIGDLISVEVSTSIGNGLQTRYWTYYTSKEECDSAMEARNHIPDEYK